MPAPDPEPRQCIAARTETNIERMTDPTAASVEFSSTAGSGRSDKTLPNICHCGSSGQKLGAGRKVRPSSTAR